MDRRYFWRLYEYRHTEKPCSFATYEWADEYEFRKQLRNVTGLEESIASLSSEWVHHLSSHQGWEEAPDLSAMKLLKGVQDGKVTFRCVEFAHMLQQVCSAFWIPARVIGVRRPNADEGFGKAHVVVDVWSNEYRKWIVMDPQLNIVYFNQLW